MTTAYLKTSLTYLQGIFSNSLIIHPSMAALHLCFFTGGLQAWKRHVGMLQNAAGEVMKHSKYYCSLQ